MTQTGHGSPSFDETARAGVRRRTSFQNEIRPERRSIQGVGSRFNTKRDTAGSLDDNPDPAKSITTGCDFRARAPDFALPPPGTASMDALAIPIPTQFFDAVVARVNGKRVAVEFRPILNAGC